jgi:RsiW-degrading membrane proteinase PrsW (M82 family)
MKKQYWWAALTAGLGLATITWAIIDAGASFDVRLVVGSAALPLAVLLLVSGRLGIDPPWSALVGGGTIGVGISLIGHFLMFAVAYALFLGFADAAVELLDGLRLDPRVTSVLESPWAALVLFDLVLVAPITEEFGKAVGAQLAHPTGRRAAFLAGVAAGSGFAVVENVLYAAGGGFFGEAWEAVVLGRILGVAVHPLASGLVAMGWWEYREGRDLGHLVGRFLSGVGIHALWNGSLVVLGVVATASDLGDTPGSYALTSLAYVAALGVVTAGALWRLTVSVASGAEGRISLDVRDGRIIAGWALLAASLLLPVAMLLLAFPELVG